MNDTSANSEGLPRFFWPRLMVFILLLLVGFILGGENTAWSDLKLDWPTWAYPLCAAGALVLAGLILWPRAWPAMFVGAPVAGAGGWLAVHTFLAAVDSYFTLTAFLIYFLGMLPGFGLFMGAAYLLQSRTRYDLLPDVSTETEETDPEE